MKTGPMAPDPTTDYPVTDCHRMIGSKWKPAILFCIGNGMDRLGATLRANPGITAQMLIQQLRELGADGLLSRPMGRWLSSSDSTITRNIEPFLRYFGLLMIPSLHPKSRSWRHG